MTLKPMGTVAPRVTPREAAKTLGVTVRTLHNLTKQGLLRPVWRGKSKFFERADLESFLKIFNAKTDWSAVAALAMRAYVKAEANERKINEISDMLGLGVFTIEVDDGSVHAFYIDAKSRIGEDPTVLAIDAMNIAKKCLALTEEYLSIVERITGDAEPWRPFLEMAEHLCNHPPRVYFQHDVELQHAYAYLEAARRHLRPLAYFYVRRGHGRRIADKAFNVHDDFAAPIVRALFPT